jgi:hypothetical protein
MSYRFRIAWFLVLLPAHLIWGQSARSVIVGAVTDPSGAPVSNAHVTVDNTVTGFQATSLTGDGGSFIIPNLAPGIYRVTVSAQGFRTEVVSNIIVNLDQTVRIDVKLNIGELATKVEVTASTPVIQTDNSSVGQIVDGKQISSLPLNGRQNLFGLLALAPGVQNPGMNPYVAGNGGFGAVNLTIDGVSGNDAGNERNLATVPSLESIGEFKVIANNASAEFGRGGAQIVLSSKSGTNELRGSLFYFNRNRVTAANSFFNNRAGIPRQVFNRNEYGASLGGPVIKNKLFYFGAFEGFRLARAGQIVTQMPTVALRQGDFSALPSPIRDPFNNGVPFPNNRIPSNRIGRVPQRLDRFFSEPNLPGTPPAGLGNNYTANIPVVEPVDRYSIKVDYALTQSDRLSGRFFRSANGPFKQSGVFFSSAVGGPGTEKFGNWDGFGNATNNTMIQYTRTLSPTLLNEARFGWQHNRFFRTPQNSNFDPTELIPGLIKPVEGLGGLPGVSILGFRGFSDSPGSGDRQATYEVYEAVTWVRGGHIVKMGFEFQRVSSFNRQNTPPQRGQFTFDGRYTGHPFADYLLGALSFSSRNTRNALNENLNNRYFAFLQHDWQVTRSLTLNLGVRYEYATPFDNAQGDIANWDPTLNRVVVVKGLQNADPRLLRLPVIDGSTQNINVSNYIFPDRNNWAPRLGFAWRPFGNRFVVRSSYGIFYNVIAGYNGLLGMGITNPPFRAQETFEPLPGPVPSITWDNPFPGSGNLPSNPALLAVARNRVNPYMQQWNYTMEYQAARNTGVRVSYLGNKGTKLERNANPNEPPMAPGPVQPRRPFQPWGPITYWESGRNSILHQLQLGILRRYDSGFAFQLEYQFSRALNEFTFGDAPANNRNFRYDRGNQDGIRRHWFVANYAYDLPFGRGQRFLSGAKGLANKFVTGWQLTGIISAGTGQPYSVTFTSTQLGWLSSRADIVSSYEAAQPANRSIDRWFAPEAFAIPAPFTFGNSARNALFGPNLFAWDPALFKTTQITERLRAVFRTEFFNVLNRANFGNPAVNISVPATVGRIASTITDPRTIQFGLRLEF